MVESYSKNANHNMRRPVVKEEIVSFMRERQAPVTDALKELEEFARRENIPIIPHETVAFFRLFLQTMQPKSILEIGTAIGFSALLMAEQVPDARITTIDRNEEMIGFAKENLAKYDQRKQITLLEGDAVDVLEDLTETYDFVLWTLLSLSTSSFYHEFSNSWRLGESWYWMIFSKEEMLPKTSWKCVVGNEPFTGGFRTSFMRLSIIQIWPLVWCHLEMVFWWFGKMQRR